MIRASQNEQMGTHRPRQGKPRRGGSDALAPVRLNSVGGQGLPVTGAGFGRRPFQFSPQRSPSRWVGRARGAITAAASRSGLFIQCAVVLPQQRWPAGPIAHRAGKPVGFNSKTAEHAFQNLIQPSPVVFQSTSPSPNQRSDGAFSSVPNLLSREQDV